MPNILLLCPRIIFYTNFRPRASAVAERLWSPPEQTADPAVAWPRLHEHRCRMIARGYRTEPINGPDYCSYEWDDEDTVNKQ